MGAFSSHPYSAFLVTVTSIRFMTITMTCLVVLMSFDQTSPAFLHSDEVKITPFIASWCSKNVTAAEERRVWAGIAQSAACEIVMNERRGEGGSPRGDPLFSFEEEIGIFAVCVIFFDEQQAKN